MFMLVILKSVLVTLLIYTVKGDLDISFDPSNRFDLSQRSADEKAEWTAGPLCPTTVQTYMVFKVQVPWQFFAPHQAVWLKSDCNYTIDFFIDGVYRRFGMYNIITE